jgi:cytochrome P450
MTTAADPYGLLSPEARRDPYPAYARLRAHRTLHFSEAWNGWLLVRYRDVAAGFRDPRLSASRASAYGALLPPPLRAKLDPLLRNISSWALLMDPPSHTRLRGLLNKAFTPRLAESLRPRIEQLTVELLDGLAGRGEVDLMAELANPLPIIVIGELLGLPAADRPRLKEWSDALAHFLGSVRLEPAIIEAALRAIVEMEAYFRAALDQRRSKPTDDLLTSLLAAEEEGRILNEQELLATCSLILFGGHETTAYLIGNGIKLLYEHPEQLAAVRSEPQCAASAVEEVLRFESPVQRMGRLALDDMELGGQAIRKGDRIWLVMAAANRDGEYYPSPDRFDVRRGDNRHLGFGLGAHYCIGASLGRLEAQLALSGLAQRYPELRLVEREPEWLDNLTIRGLTRLPVELGVRTNS